jgi:lipoprotein-releasing system ATP-binding protein
MLEATNLCKAYQMGDSRIEVLSGLDLRVERAEFLSVVGASGTGKSTLLHLLGGLDAPDEGRVMLAGEPILSSDERRTADRRNRRIGFVFQFHHLLPEFSALENAAMPQRIAGVKESTAHSEARSRLEDVGLGERFHHLPSQLSGGERQRVAFARAMVNDPDLLLMDEPTGNLDPKSARALFELVKDLQQRKGLTIVMATHNMDLAGQTDGRVVLVDGKLTEAP